MRDIWCSYICISRINLCTFCVSSKAENSSNKLQFASTIDHRVTENKIIVCATLCNALFQFFPDITVCKIAQLNTLYTSSLNYSKYISDTEARKSRWPFDRVRTVIPDIDAEFYEVLWSYLESKEGYYYSLPLDIHQVENKESRDNPFVIGCRATTWDSASYYDCSVVALSSWHRRYYRCLNINLPDSHRKVRSSAKEAQNIAAVRVFTIHLSKFLGII